MDGIMIELILWTNNPEIPMDYISHSIEIPVVDEELIGDTKYYGELKNLQRIVDASSLRYSTDYIDTKDVEVAVYKMIDIIEPQIHKIEAAVVQYALNVKFCVVINLDQKPVISISDKFIQIMARLSAELEFDMYITNNKKRIFSWIDFIRRKKEKLTRIQ